MRDAYRDDLAAMELRVRDLEHERAALQAHNEKLEALVARPPTPMARTRQIPRPIVQVGAMLAITTVAATLLGIESLAISALIGLLIDAKVGLLIYLLVPRKE